MRARARILVAPLYLLLCLLLGGSTQGIWANLALQLTAVAILAWAALTREPAAASSSARSLWILVPLGLALVLLQLVPMPPALWTSLPGRVVVVEGFRLLGIDPGWRPLSLAPYATLATVQALLPPIAMLAAMLRLGAYSDNRLAGALLLGALASILLGMLQVAAGGDWYLYRFVNINVATGFFANSNHMSALLMVAVPFVAAIAADQWRLARKANARAVILAVAAGCIVLLGVGIVLGGSEAVFLLSVPVTLASALMAFSLSRLARRRGMVVVAVLVAVILAAASVFLARDGLDESRATSVSSRVVIWENSLEAAADHFPLGSGVGTFPAVYPIYEDPKLVDRAFVNHAHNDYLELALETGLPGMLLIAAFLLWWARRAVAAWRSSLASFHMKAASIASAALLLHSLVDFPLRNAALSSVFAMCLALLAVPRRQAGAEEPGELRPARHLAL